MANFKLKRFANVTILRRIDPGLLIEFLQPFCQFLSGQCGMAWPDDPRDLDYSCLANILMSPPANLPEDLLDALYFADTLADDEHYDRLLEEATKAKIDLGPHDPSPEDLTLRIWLADQSILERVHAEQYWVRPKTFRSYYCSDIHHHDWTSPDTNAHKALEENLNKWFDFKKKGRGARVFFFPSGEGVWLLVRHGQMVRREGTIETGGDPGSVFYRPEKFDVLIYYPKTGELAIHNETKGERGVYCRLIGRHIFDDADFFRFDNPIPKYTLQPLVNFGPDCLACGDVDGIAYVHLYELHLRHDSEQKNIEIRRADDVFLALAQQQRFLQEEQGSMTMLRAKFKVTFVGGRKRTITIEPPNTASFDREMDNTMIHNWLLQRGFIITDNTEEHEDADAVLEVA